MKDKSIKITKATVKRIFRNISSISMDEDDIDNLEKYEIDHMIADIEFELDENGIDVDKVVKYLCNLVKEVE